MKKKLVLDMADSRPVWSMPEGSVEDIRATLPDDWTLHRVGAPADGSGDGAAGPSPEALEAVALASVYLGFGVPAALLRAGPHLRWVHSGTAGIGSSLTPEMRSRDVRFTNSAGVHGPPMGETVLAMILHFARGLDFAVRARTRGRWEEDPFYREDSPVREVGDAVVGVVGYGGVGAEVGRRAAAVGARVLGLTRTAPTSREREADLPGVERLHGPGGLPRLLTESDYVVLTVPETDETRGMVDREFLASMRKGAVLVNVSRGSLVDEEALVEALRDGHLRGAALDVFRREPLPPDSPFWKLENVLLTPHVSAVSRGYWRRETALITENLRRFLAGEELLNVVDPDAGY